MSNNSAWKNKLLVEAHLNGNRAKIPNEERPSPRTREEISKAHYGREDKKDNILLSVEVQCEWLRDIGFGQVDVFFKSYELAVFAGKKSPFPEGFGLKNNP